MHIVLFRAKIRHFDEEYTEVAARMRELAMTEFGCLDFQAVAQGDDEVAISWWPDEASIRAWRQNPEHLEAQRKGRERWYDSWSIEVAAVTRRYDGAGESHSAAAGDAAGESHSPTGSDGVGESHSPAGGDRATTRRATVPSRA